MHTALHVLPLPSAYMHMPKRPVAMQAPDAQLVVCECVEWVC